MDSDIFIEEFEQDFVEVLSAILRAENSWEAKYNPDHCHSVFNDFCVKAQEIVDGTKLKHEALNKILDQFYGNWGFSGTSHKIDESILNSVSYALQYRTGSSLSLAVILNQLLQKVGFNANLLFFYGDLAVNVAMSSDENYVINPASGQQNWLLKVENAPEEEQQDSLHLVVDEDVLKLYLGHQKWALIGEKKLEQALVCVDLLMDQTGNDPYERRDRGYLLQQLDCHQMARDDFEFFISECPDDPSVELLQAQMEEMELDTNTLH